MAKRATLKTRGENLPAELLRIINRDVYYVTPNYLIYKELELQIEQRRRATTCA